MHQRSKSKAISSLARRKRFSPLMLVGLSVPVVLALIASAVLFLPHLGSRAAAVTGSLRSGRSNQRGNWPNLDLQPTRH